MDLIGHAIDLARENVEGGGRPFACVIARGQEVVAASANLVAQTHDPTAHAEVLAIRKACTKLRSENLYGHDVYVLAHPCPMCLTALYYCSPDRVVFITTRQEYANYYVDDRKYFELTNLYDEIAKPWETRRLPMTHSPDPRAIGVYARWSDLNRG